MSIIMYKIFFHAQSSMWVYVSEMWTWARSKINLYNHQSYYNLIVIEESTLSFLTMWLFHVTVALHHLLCCTSLIILLQSYLSSLTVVPRRKGKYYGLNYGLDSDKQSPQNCKPELKHLWPLEQKRDGFWIKQEE